MGDIHAEIKLYKIQPKVVIPFRLTFDAAVKKSILCRLHIGHTFYLLFIHWTHQPFVSPPPPPPPMCFEVLGPVSFPPKASVANGTNVPDRPVMWTVGVAVMMCGVGKCREAVKLVGDGGH